MTMKAKLVIILIAAALLAGCLSTSDQPAEVQTSEMAGVQTTLTIDVPSLQGIMIKAGIISDMRVIPSDLDPNTQFTEIIIQYQMAASEDQHLRWFIGAPSGYSVFWLSVDTLTSTPNELITLQYPIEVIITPTEISAINMNFVAPIYGGGGGVVNSFPVMNLQSGVQSLSPDVVETAELNSNLATGVLYEFSFQCVQPGVFNVHINQTYVLNVNSVLSTQMLPYDILFACPLSATLWMFDPNTKQVVATQSWAWNNGFYTQQESR